MKSVERLRFSLFKVCSSARSAALCNACRIFLAEFSCCPLYKNSAENILQALQNAAERALEQTFNNVGHKFFQKTELKFVHKVCCC